MKLHRLLICLAALCVSCAAAAAGGAVADSGSASGVVSACVHVRGGGLYMARRCAGRDADRAGCH